MTSSRLPWWLAAVALEVPAALLALSEPRFLPMSLLTGLVALVFARFGGHLRGGLVLRVALGCAGLAAAMGLLLLAPGARPRLGAFVVAGALGVAIPQALVVARRVGLGWTLGLGLLALAGLGRAVGRLQFGVAVALFLTLAVWASLASDAAWEPPWRERRGSLWPLIPAGVIALGTLVGLGWALPAAEPAVQKVLGPYLIGGVVGESGFGEGRMQLGDVGRVVTSDEVVMRVHGPLDYLRGKVYVHYFRGRWWERTPPGYVAPRVEEGALALGEGPTVGARIRVEAEASSGAALFAPMGASRLEGSPSGVARDPYGVLTLPPELISEPRSFSLLPGAPAQRLLLPPGERDRWVRDHRFAELARAWTVGLVGDAARVEALVNHLRRSLRYSLEPGTPPEGVEPVYWFLTVGKAGHCEYFASALALLSRSLGVPARLVAGYRVFERNPVGDYFVVRKRDAHAWTEIYLNGVWRTVDPTPVGSLEGEAHRESSWWTARWDVFARGFWRAFERLAGLSVREVAAALGLVAALLLLWLRVRARGAPVPSAAPPFAPLVELEAHLLGRGLRARAPAETLARYAEHLGQAGEPEAAALLVDLGRLRYGGRGDAEGLASRVRRLVAVSD